MTSGIRRLCVFISVASLGCTTRHLIHPSELSKLGGHDLSAPCQRPRMRDIEGEEVEYRSEMTLRFKTEASKIDGKFKRLDVSEGSLVGLTVSGEKVSLPLGTLRHAELQTISPTSASLRWFVRGF